MHDSLKIGHITDLHARSAIYGSANNAARRSRAMNELLNHALTHFKAHKVDLIVVTGDLVDVPSFVLDPSDYYHMPIEPWLPLIEADYRQIKALLDNAGMPYIVLPGNHDYEPMMWQVFDQVRDVVDIQAGQSETTYRVARFCDREWEGHVPRRFDRERQRWLDLLADQQSPPQIHLQHYVITPPVESSYPHNYLEAEELLYQTANAEQVVLSLAGHYHRGSDLQKFANTYFTVGPAFCEFPHPIRIYEVTPGQVTMETISLCTEPHDAGRQVVFLDRDGVINDLPSYRTGPEAMTLIPGAAQAILDLKHAGYAVVVITNQSAVGAGYTSPRVVDMVHERMCQLLVETTGDPAAQPDAIFYSIGAGSSAVQPAWADQSTNKPSPQMLQQAQSLLGLDPNGAWMVGDRASDIEAAQAFGATPILVRTGNGRQTEELLDTAQLEQIAICDDLLTAVRHILQQAK